MGSFFLEILSKWYIWLPIAAVFAYLAFRNNLRAKTVAETEHTLLILEIPRTNDKKELAAEQMFASLHGILRDKKELMSQGGLQEHISFEIAAIEKQIRFYVWVPTHLQNFLEGQIYAQYPTVQIYKAESDYTEREILQPVAHSAELTLIDNEALPIKTFQSFEVDPLAAVTATLAKLDEQNEEVWIQVLARPISDNWHYKSTKFANRLKGKRSSGALALFVGLLQAFFKAPEAKDSTAAPEMSERDKSRVSEIEKKSIKLGYQVKIRIQYLGNTEKTAKLRMQAIVGTFKQFNSTNLNGFQSKGAMFGQEGIDQYRARFFIDKGYVLNIEELASVYHLPHTTVETPNIVWANSKTAEPPAKLPIIIGTERDNDVSAFGLTNFRGINQQFGLFRGDRGRHMYIIGQTGTGKSGMLELLTLSDVFHNQGYAIIDPHGDFATANLKFIPPSRVKDVVYFNPADMQFPIGFNPMEVSDPNMKSHISSEVIGVLKRMFGESWGPRLEYILRYTILALLDYPNTTLLDITRMLTDKKFRKAVVENCQDTVVKQFWNVEFASWNDKFLAEAISPVLNKVGAFTANPIIRNIIGQPKSTFNIRQIMDEGKILVVNLSKGLIGEDNAGILGSFLVTKIQLAAMSRSDIPNIEDRRPFYLYVDEFQNFATDSFATILSEARKYGLNLTVANQYVSQMGETVRDAVFGNVGTTISFRVSPDDSQVLGKQFAPQFLPEDLMQMANRHFVITMVINGEKTPTFSARTLTLPPAQTNFTPQIIENTRSNYARPVNDVIAEIQNNVNPTHNQQQQAPAQPQTQQKANSAAPKQTFVPKVDNEVKIERNETKIEHKKLVAAPAIKAVTENHAHQSEPKPTDQPESASKKRRRRRKRSGKGQGSGEQSTTQNTRQASEQVSSAPTTTGTPVPLAQTKPQPSQSDRHMPVPERRIDHDAILNLRK